MFNFSEWIRDKIHGREIKIFCRILQLPTARMNQAESLHKKAIAIENLESANKLITTVIFSSMAITLAFIPDAMPFLYLQFETAGRTFLLILLCVLILAWQIISFFVYILFYKKRINSIAQEIKAVTTSDKAYGEAFKKLLEIDPALGRKLKKYSLP